MLNDVRSVRITGSLSVDDHLAAMWLHMRPRRLYYWLGIALCLLAGAVMIHQIFFVPLTWSNAWVPIAFFIGVLLIANYFFIALPKQARRIFHQQKLLHETQTIEIHPEFLITSSGRTHRKVRWDIFYNYKYSRRLLLLYQSEAIFNIFPRRWFASDLDYDLFVSYIKRNVATPADKTPTTNGATPRLT